MLMKLIKKLIKPFLLLTNTFLGNLKLNNIIHTKRSRRKYIYLTLVLNL